MQVRKRDTSRIYAMKVRIHASELRFDSMIHS